VSLFLCSGLVLSPASFGVCHPSGFFLQERLRGIIFVLQGDTGTQTTFALSSVFIDGTAALELRHEANVFALAIKA